jgi:uncharacterized BrkB/YihY/UPF0761 family membrane protein
MAAGDLRGLVRDIAEGSVAHRLPQHSAAIAFRILVSLVPLALLAKAISPAEFVERISSTEKSIPVKTGAETRSRIAGASESDQTSRKPSAPRRPRPLLLLWELSRAVRSIMVALDEIHDVEESRSAVRVLATTLVLAAVIGVCIVASVLAVIVLPRLASGFARVGLTLVAYGLAVVLLGVVAALIVRYAPAEHPSPRWASAGSAVVVAVWLVRVLAVRLVGRLDRELRAGGRQPDRLPRADRVRLHVRGDLPRRRRDRRAGTRARSRSRPLAESAGPAGGGTEPTPPPAAASV